MQALLRCFQLAVRHYNLALKIMEPPQPLPAAAAEEASLSSGYVVDPSIYQSLLCSMSAWKASDPETVQCKDILNTCALLEELLSLKTQCASNILEGASSIADAISCRVTTSYSKISSFGSSSNNNTDDSNTAGEEMSGVIGDKENETESNSSSNNNKVLLFQRAVSLFTAK